VVHVVVVVVVVHVVVVVVHVVVVVVVVVVVHVVVAGKQITRESASVPRTTPKYDPFCCASILSESLNALESRNLSHGNLYNTYSLQHVVMHGMRNQQQWRT